jgi:hypothetical protein
LSQPDAIKAAAPWIREVRDPQTGRRRLEVGSADATTVIAEVARSGIGNRDDPGEFASAMAELELEALGLGPPPYHARCRTTTVPVV